MAPFDVSWLPERECLVIRLTGFWPDSIIPPFERAVFDAVARAAGKPFDCIADLADLKPQSAGVVGLQAGVIARLRSAGMRTLVIADAGPLLTMQVKRAAAPLVLHFVATYPQARDWLNGQAGR